MSSNREGPRGLVYHAGGLGDFVLSLPAIFRLLQSRPGHRWAFWGPAERLALLPDFDRAPSELLRLGHTLWGEHPSSEALGSLAGFAVLLAFGGSTPPPWATRAKPRVLGISSFPPPGGPWVPVHQGRQLDALGVPRVRERWIPQWRSRMRPHAERDRVVLHPGSGDLRKNLPAQTWRRVVEELKRGAKGLRVELAVGPTELEKGGWEHLAAAVDRVWECGELEGLLRALDGAELFLGNDSGASHLAALLGVPAVVAFAPSDPGLWRPLGRRVRVVRPAGGCAPCTGGEPIRCQNPVCTQAVDADEIVSRAKELLGDAG